MLLNWFCLLAVGNFHFSNVFAVPAQKFSPGIPITPTQNQNPGEVNGVLEAGSPGPVKVSAPTYKQPAAPSTVVIRTRPTPTSVIVQPSHQQQQSPVYLESNKPFYSSPQYAGQQPTAYVYPDGTYAPAPPQPIQTGTRFGNTYLGSGPLSALLGDATRWGSSSPSAWGSGIRPSSAGQALGALGALGTAGLLGAGALGAGALLLG
nr:uncharacterized protein LOC115263113 isoform X2 [Aedes albopictus]